MLDVESLNVALWLFADMLRCSAARLLYPRIPTSEVIIESISLYWASYGLQYCGKGRFSALVTEGANFKNA